MSARRTPRQASSSSWRRGTSGSSGQRAGASRHGDVSVFEVDRRFGLDACDATGEVARAAFEVRGGEQGRQGCVLARLLGGGGLQVGPQVTRRQAREILLVQGDQAAPWSHGRPRNCHSRQARAARIRPAWGSKRSSAKAGHATGVYATSTAHGLTSRRTPPAGPEPKASVTRMLAALWRHTASTACRVREVHRTYGHRRRCRGRHRHRASTCIVKSLVFIAGRPAILVLASGPNRVDVDESRSRLVGAAHRPRQCQPGAPGRRALPSAVCRPFGHTQTAGRPIVDRDLLAARRGLGCRGHAQHRLRRSAGRPGARHRRSSRRRRRSPASSRRSPAHPRHARSPSAWPHRRLRRYL